jgi:hypothetical protein
MILTASNLHRNLGIVLTVSIALWGFVSEFVAAFQCGVDEPWRFIGVGSKCVSMVSLPMFLCGNSEGLEDADFQNSWLSGVVWGL